MKPDQMHASDSSPGLLEKIATTECLIFKENLQIQGQHPDTYYRNSPDHQAEIILQQLVKHYLMNEMKKKIKKMYKGQGMWESVIITRIFWRDHMQVLWYPT